MSITINHRDGRALYVAEGAADVREAVEQAVREHVVLRRADLRRAALRGTVLRGAVLRGADLTGADLTGAVLRGAVLRGTDLTGAALRGAVLRGTDLTGAVLRDARGVDWRRIEPLHAMTLHDGPHHAHKLVTTDGLSPIQQKDPLTYRVGDTITTEADTDPTVGCGAGVNVATLPWCLRQWQPGRRILVVRFTRADIACIPHGTDGKFRLHRCEVVEDITDQATANCASEVTP